MQQKKIEGFSQYEITDDGRVWSCVSNKFILPQWDKKTRNKYFYVKMRPDDAEPYSAPLKRYIHQLVAKAFVPNPENKKQVDHIDDNKHNNNASNLQWVTHSENVKKAFASGLNKGTTGFKFSEESKAKKSESMKKSWVNKSEEDRKAFSEKCRNRMLGNKLSEETKEKLRQKAIERRIEKIKRIKKENEL